jgi:hypothetical protein
MVQVLFCTIYIIFIKLKTYEYAHELYGRMLNNLETHAIISLL